MSFGNENLLGGFTELEIAAGIPSLVDGTDRGYLDDFEENTFDDDSFENDNECSKSKDSKFENYLLKKYEYALAEKSNPILQDLACCLTLEDVKYKTIQALMLEEVQYIIERFGKREVLPKYCLDIANDNDCLEKIIKGFLKKILKINPSSEVVKEVELISKKLLENKALETPYDRVSKIQSYIHNKSRFINGVNGHKEIPRNQMRLFLATARLHLSINDLFRRDCHDLHEYFEGKMEDDTFHGSVPLSYFGYLYKKSESQAEIERNYPSIVEPINGTYQPHWSVRHKKNISYYCKIETREKIEELQRVNNCKNLLQGRALCFHIYCKN